MKYVVTFLFKIHRSLNIKLKILSKGEIEKIIT